MMGPILLLPNGCCGGRLSTHRLTFLAGRRLRLNFNVSATRGIRHLHSRLSRSGFNDRVRDGRLIPRWLRKEQQAHHDPNQQAADSPNFLFHVLSPDFPNVSDSYLSLLYTILPRTHLKVSTRRWLPVMITPFSARIARLATAAIINSNV